ncbi:hypothetical protein HBI56_075430 [Parastagonospora nodorum]|uniref:Uncharacterized protein n=1 Tax=Phaeosphaeria nodorum (strain SN15 / ATCC MYA-4574 / FGSC 10173) TaxID=321614 RepID=A0A7U2EWE9_PHANO|nr:hypothetical protein HBH56_169560 [Parastagonospora nodorum]QRC94373.1 hypothetical protein JI435_405710 [Parastagonospora nodorum SN15]KAH3928366.1 hypothetical protein HBH54_138110 [Parastagonospora nodorum]KAH3945303.1 hypothetical protein HBH53_143460 [Parastagonospora nodorum]KAH3984184.1 hypothetical protein HBH52_060760 [Parastagonospora nodorum]
MLAVRPSSWSHLFSIGVNFWTTGRRVSRRDAKKPEFAARFELGGWRVPGRLIPVPFC